MGDGFAFNLFGGGEGETDEALPVADKARLFRSSAPFGRHEVTGKRLAQWCSQFAFSFRWNENRRCRQRARCRRDMPPAYRILAVRLPSLRCSPQVRRNKRFAQQNLGAGRIHFARASPIALGAQRPQGAKPKLKAHPVGWAFSLENSWKCES